MRIVDILYVVGNGAHFVGHVLHPIGGDEMKDRQRIDKAPDQPGTGDAVDLGSLARDPDAGFGGNVDARC